MISKISPCANFKILSVLGELSRTVFDFRFLTKPKNLRRECEVAFKVFQDFAISLDKLNKVHYINKIRFGFYQNELPLG
jgi:hypothetical protein